MWAAEWLNRLATTSNPGMRSPYEIYYGVLSRLDLLPFFKPGFRRVNRTDKIMLKAGPCYFLDGGSNHPAGCNKVLVQSSGKCSNTLDVTWAYPRTPIPKHTAGGAAGDRQGGLFLFATAAWHRRSKVRGSRGLYPRPSPHRHARPHCRPPRHRLRCQLQPRHSLQYRRPP